MRFTCPKCGKKYASSAEPAPGKAYRLKCKACGETIVLRAGGLVSSAPTPAPGTVPPVGPSRPPAPSAAPARPPAAAPPASAEPTASGAPAPERSSAELPAPTPPPAPDIPIPSGTPTPGGLASPPASPPAAPPQDDTLDLDQLLGETGPQPSGPIRADDPFAAAARASLPDGYGAGGTAPDPIAALTRDPEGLAQDAAQPRREKAPPAFSAIPKPPRPRSGATVVLLVAGLVALLAVLAFVLLGRGGAGSGEPKPPPASSRSATP